MGKSSSALVAYWKTRGERRHLFALILTMAVVVTAVTGAVLAVLYNTAFSEERARLRVAAESNARLIEAVARFDAIYSAGDIPGGAPAATLGQIREAHEHFAGFGRTGEFTLARREGDHIVFLLRHRHFDLERPRPVPFSSTFAEPMRRALQGKSGTLVGLDYRGATVLAAYEPVAVLNLGIVAKIDLSEVRAPFVRAGGLAGGIALALIVAGALMLRRIGEPMLRQIEESERKYRKIFEGGNDGMCVLSDVFEDCNEQICRIWACKREDILGHTLIDFSPPTQPDGRNSITAMRECLQATLAGEPQSFYWQHRQKDGALLDMEISLKTVEMGGRNLILAVLRDISDRRRAEAEIRARVRQQTAVAELGRSALTGTQLQGLLQKAVALVSDGLDVEYAKVLELLPDGKRLLLRAGIGWRSGLVGTATVGTDTDSQAGYTLLAHQPVIVDDLRHEERFSGPPLLTEHGVVSGLSTIIHGLPGPFGVFGAHTARHRKFSEHDVDFVQSVANLLADAIARHELEQERTRLVEEVTSKNAELEQFNYTVSHELKSPVITIRSFLDMLREDVASGDTARLDADLQHIRRASDTMCDLLDGLLNLSRLGWRAGLREPVPLGELARDVVESLAPRTAEGAVRVTVAPDFPVILADRVRLREVLQNLVENAIKFAGDGLAPRIDIGWRRVESQSVFFVSDNGVGIDPRFHERVFGLFEHLDPNTEGTGVGLALVRRIIEEHGGRIWVESDGVGKGSTFYFTIGTGDAVE